MARCTNDLSTDFENSILYEEIEVLKSIYMEELQVQNNDRGVPETVGIVLHPCTAADTDRQYVCLTVVFHLNDMYPDTPPEINLKTPRGLSEDKLSYIRKTMLDIREDRQGEAMLYELIEFVKESLTEGNMPQCPCVICLNHFTDADVFLRTECYHYFHSYCLIHYVDYVRRQLAKDREEKPRHVIDKIVDDGIVCPVCRTQITFDEDELRDAPPPYEEYNSSSGITEEYIRHRDGLRVMYEKQKSQGGIIDVEKERNRFLIRSLSRQSTESSSSGDASLFPSLASNKSTSPTNNTQKEPENIEFMNDHINTQHHPSNTDTEQIHNNRTIVSYDEFDGAENRESSDENVAKREQSQSHSLTDKHGEHFVANKIHRLWCEMSSSESLHHNSNNGDSGEEKQDLRASDIINDSTETTETVHQSTSQNSQPPQTRKNKTKYNFWDLHNYIENGPKSNGGNYERNNDRNKNSENSSRSEINDAYSQTSDNRRSNTVLPEHSTFTNEGRYVNNMSYNGQRNAQSMNRNNDKVRQDFRHLRYGYNRHDDHRYNENGRIRYENPNFNQESKFNENWKIQENYGRYNSDQYRRDIPPQSRDIPPQSRDIPPQSRDIPPQNRDIRPQNRDIPPQSRDIPPQSRDIPPQSRDIPPQSRDIPPQNRDIRPQNRDIRPQNRDIPPQNRDIPPQSRDIPPQSRDIPPQSRDIPPQSRDIPPQSRDIPPQSRDIPPQSRDIPPPSRDIPPQRKYIPSRGNITNITSSVNTENESVNVTKKDDPFGPFNNEPTTIKSTSTKDDRYSDRSAYTRTFSSKCSDMDRKIKQYRQEHANDVKLNDNPNLNNEKDVNKETDSDRNYDNIKSDSNTFNNEITVSHISESDHVCDILPSSEDISTSAKDISTVNKDIAISANNENFENETKARDENDPDGNVGDDNISTFDQKLKFIKDIDKSITKNEHDKQQIVDNDIYFVHTKKQDNDDYKEVIRQSNTSMPVTPALNHSNIDRGSHSSLNSLESQSNSAYNDHDRRQNFRRENTRGFQNNHTNRYRNRNGTSNNESHPRYYYERNCSYERSEEKNNGSKKPPINKNNYNNERSYRKYNENQTGYSNYPQNDHFSHSRGGIGFKSRNRRNNNSDQRFYNAYRHEHHDYDYNSRQPPVYTREKKNVSTHGRSDRRDMRVSENGRRRNSYRDDDRSKSGHRDERNEKNSNENRRNGNNQRDERSESSRRDEMNENDHRMGNDQKDESIHGNKNSQRNKSSHRNESTHRNVRGVTNIPMRMRNNSDKMPETNDKYNDEPNCEEDRRENSDNSNRFDNTHHMNGYRNDNIRPSNNRSFSNVSGRSNDSSKSVGDVGMNNCAVKGENYHPQKFNNRRNNERRDYAHKGGQNDQIGKDDKNEEKPIYDNLSKSDISVAKEAQTPDSEYGNDNSRYSKRPEEQAKIYPPKKPHTRNGNREERNDQNWEENKNDEKPIPDNPPKSDDISVRKNQTSDSEYRNCTNSGKRYSKMREKQSKKYPPQKPHSRFEHSAGDRNGTENDGQYYYDNRDYSKSRQIYRNKKDSPIPYVDGKRSVERKYPSDGKLVYGNGSLYSDYEDINLKESMTFHSQSHRPTRVYNSYRRGNTRDGGYHRYSNDYRYDGDTAWHMPRY